MVLPPSEASEDLRETIENQRKHRMFDELVDLLKNAEEGECVAGRALELAQNLRERCC